MRKIVDFEVLHNYQVRLRFDDGFVGVAHLDQLVGHGAFAAWKEHAFFRQTFLSPHGALTWPGALNLCPGAFYLQISGKDPEELFSNLKLASHA
jgi:hypothetical protein